ncbi:Hypothetical predicted protein [Mytilus galloprovincialis]|uniref:DUF4371 domain-containing protein n=1 Tax=Mytilus galloprovincialis TaxID=29158 RepID=A0A8B6EN34_MYTGA|nr:Hypothetical predicted protein [Mytilus galloprovincialis]
MEDLLNLKLAIQSNNREHEENIFELYKQDLSTFSQPFSSEQYEILVVDLLASVLIPFDLPLPLYEVSTVKTLGNRNCLFNSVSFLLCHSYRLSTTLRILTGAKLFINANKYAHHPKLKLAHDCPEITYDRKNLFAILLREKASMVSDHVEAVQTEAAVTCYDRQWSGMFDIMALSPVLKKNIWAAYPDCNHNIRPIISGVVEQLSCTIPQSDLENTLFILWSRDGDLDSTRGHPFEPNHFVPIICKPANQDDLHTNYEEPPFKKMKVNAASVSHQEQYSDGNNNFIDNADFGVGNNQKHENRNSLTIFQKNEEGHQTSSKPVKPPETRTSALQSEKAKRVAENRTILSSIIEATQYCARQCIALRGDKEDLSTSGNPGNCLAILKLMSQKDDLLKQHLDHSKQQNSTYLSPSNQNELTDLMGNMIRSKIISEIQEAKYFSIMADEVESYNKEKMSLCVRFVDSNSDIREEIIDFVSLLRINGEHIANAIMQTL